MYELSSTVSSLDTTLWESKLEGTESLNGRARTGLEGSEQDEGHNAGKTSRREGSSGDRSGSSSVIKLFQDTDSIMRPSGEGAFPEVGNAMVPDNDAARKRAECMAWCS